jgi:hypothetical protein
VFLVQAQALQDSGDPTASITAYHHVLKPRRRGLWSPSGIAVHYDLGRLVEEVEEVAGAREQYAA